MSRHLVLFLLPSFAQINRRSWCRALGSIFLGFLVGLSTTEVLAQDDASEASMAAYADAANFQTGGANELAIEAWNSFLGKYPKHPLASKAAHYLGVCYMQKENPDYVAASKAFAQALKDKTYDLREESLANHGWCLFVSAGDGEQRDTAKLQRAAEIFQTLRKENPKSRFLDRAIFYSGEAAYGLGQPKKAIQFYDQLLSMPNAKESPLRCDTLYARGVAYEELDQFEDAFASYNQLLSSCDSGSLATDVRLRIGDLMILRKEFDKAIKSFADALKSAESEEDRSYALFRQAFALVQANRPSEAAETYEQLISDFPDSQYAASAVLASAQSIYRSGDIDVAAQRFQKVLAQQNLTAATEAAHWLARIEISKGRPAEAIQIVRRQLDRGVKGDFTTDLRLDLAEALSMDPKTVEESMVLYEKVYRDAPGDALAPRALYNAAFSALQINQPKRALALALEFITKFPKDTLVPDIRFVAAEGQLLTGKTQDAADTYQHLLTTTSKDNIQRPVWLLRAGAACNAASKFDDTVRILGEELESLPQSAQKAEAQMLIGQAHLRADRASQATKAFQASREADPKWARADEALLLSGQAQMASGDSKGAISSWQQLIKTAPNSRMADQARYKLAQLASGKGDFDQAVRYYDEILASKKDPGLIPYAQYGKGWALMQSEKYELAFDSLDRLLKQVKQHSLRNDAMLARGMTLRNLGKLDHAKRDLESYLAIPPKGTNLGHALYELALIDQEEKEPGKAAVKLERLVKEVPNYPSMDQVLYELGWALQETGNDDAAVKHFTTLIAKYPDTSLIAEAAYFVGMKHYHSKQWKLAAEQFKVAAGKASDPVLSEKVHYRLGWSQLKVGDHQAAETTFANQAKKHPNGKLAFDATMMVGECRFKRSDFKAALAGFEVARDKIREGKEDSKSVRNAADRQIRELVFLHGGQSAAQTKAWDVAIAWYDELRKRFPSSAYLPQVFYETGYAYQQKGDKKNALKFFQEVADNYRNELAARARFMMGEIHFANREFDRAIPEFQRVMFGFGANKAPDRIKNWQAKSGFEAARCSELLMQAAKTPRAKQQALKYAKDFHSYVIEKHPKHELAEKSRERVKALKK